jgi:hypothetical protein
MACRRIAAGPDRTGDASADLAWFELDDHQVRDLGDRAPTGHQSRPTIA